MELAAVGDNCMDLYPDGRAFPGGNPVNVAVYTRRLGHRASYTGAVGSDDYGRQMLDALAKKGVDTSHVKTMEGKTAVTQVEIEDGERLLGDYDEGVLADFTLNEADLDFLAGHRLVVSGLWGMVEGYFPELRRRGATTAFDFADKMEHPVIDAAIPFTDYAFFGYDGEDEGYIRAYLQTMQAKGPKVAVATWGAKGSLAFNGERFFQCGIEPCRVVDTMGAGDSYIAGFLCGVLEGLPTGECMQKGAKNSSETIGYVGTW